MSVPPFVILAGTSVQTFFECRFAAPPQAGFTLGGYVLGRWPVVLPFALGVAALILFSVLLACCRPRKSCCGSVAWLIAGGAVAVVVVVLAVLVALGCFANDSIVDGVAVGEQAALAVLQDAQVNVTILKSLSIEYLIDTGNLFPRLSEGLRIAQMDEQNSVHVTRGVVTGIVAVCSAAAGLAVLTSIAALCAGKRVGRCMVAIAGGLALLLLGAAATASLASAVVVSDARRAGSEEDWIRTLGCPEAYQFASLMLQIEQLNATAVTARQHADAATALGISQSLIDCGGALQSLSPFGSNVRSIYNPVMYSLFVLETTLVALLLIAYLVAIALDAEAGHKERMTAYEQLPNPLN